MSTGGATWLTAGALTLDSDNTMALGVTDGPQVERPHYRAWWVYTPATSGWLTLDTETTTLGGTASSGDPGDTLIYVFEQTSEPDVNDHLHEDDDSGEGRFSLLRAPLEGGVTYRILVGSFDEDGNEITTYRLRASFVAGTTYVYSPWFTLPDDPEQNLIIVANDRAPLIEQNPNPDFASPPFSGGIAEWLDDVIRGMQSRRGSYSVQEALGGDPVHDGLACTIAHADVGHEDSQVWNSTGSGTSPTPGVCMTVPTGGTADPHFAGDSVHVQLHTETTDLLAADSAGTTLSGPAYALFHKAVRDSMPWYGALYGDVLDALDPTAHGLPASATLIPEAEHADLLGIDIADADPEPTHLEYTKLWAVNDPVGPVWDILYPDLPGVTSTPWNIGPVAQGPTIEDPERPYFPFEYVDDDTLAGLGDPDVERWTTLPSSEDGWRESWVEDWEFIEDEHPTASDDVVTCWPSAFPTTIPENSVYDETRNARIAVRYRLAVGGRYRFRWIPQTTIAPPRRIGQRSDGLTGGPTRVVGGGNTVQRGLRVGPGAIL